MLNFRNDLSARPQGHPDSEKWETQEKTHGPVFCGHQTKPIQTLGLDGDKDLTC